MVSIRWYLGSFKGQLGGCRYLRLKRNIIAVDPRGVQETQEVKGYIRAPKDHINIRI